MRTQIITLKKGFKVGDQYHKDVVLREANLGDMMAAENDAPAYNPISFKAALICRCIEKVDGVDVPVSIGMMQELSPTDWNILARGFDGLEEAGNGS